MKKRTFLSLIIFTCFLAFGYSVSARFNHSNNGNLSNPISSTTNANSNTILSMNNGQRSLLLIGVDTLNTSKSDLASLWLVTYLPPDSTFHMLPIFPSGKDSLSDFERQLSRSFSLDRKNGDVVLSQKFTHLLELNNYWWGGYFIIDQVAMTEIIHLLASDVSKKDSIAGNQKIEQLPDVMDDPQKAFSTQLDIIQTACHQLVGSNHNPDWSQVIALVPDHLLTNLDLNLFLMEWNALSSLDQNPNCRFPTLEISGID